MGEDASAGRLYAEVLADTSKFRADAEKKLKAALKDLKAQAKVKVELSAAQARTALNGTLRDLAKDPAAKSVKARIAFDASQARTALNSMIATLAKGERGRAIKARITFDASQALKELNRVLREISRSKPEVLVKVRLDAAKAEAELKRLKARKRSTTLNADADTSEAERDIEGVRQRASAKPVDLNVRVPTSALSRVGQALTKLSAFPAISSGILLAAGAVANLTGGLFALTASASQAVGVLAAIPNVIGVAAQGIGTLLLGFSGVGDAVKALGKAQQQTGATAQKSGAAQVAAAQAVADAQEQVARAQEAAAERVADAQRRVADAQEQAMERVRAAQENLARTQEAAAERAAEAEQAVARAREAAAERVIEAQRRIADAQQQAAERIADAQRRIAEAQQQAAERVQEARENLARVTEAAAERTAAAEQHVADAQAAGAQRIVDAQRRVADAHRTVQQAVEGLQQATEQATERAQDLALQLSGAALDEEGAQLALERATNRLRDIMSPESTASELDKREADLAYRQAVQRLAEIREGNEDLAAEKAELDRTGIQGSREVTDAQQRLNEAVQAETEARAELGQVSADVARAVAEAQQELAKVQRDNARDIADAQTDIATAQADGARAVAEAQRELATAQAEGARDITDAQQDLVEAQQEGARDIADAQQDLVETQRDNARDIADAQRDITDAQTEGARDIADAQRDLAKAQRDSARQVADAQQDLARAMARGADSAETTTAAMTALNTAMNNLSPAGQRFARFINGTLKPRFKELRFAVQEALLPPLQEAITKALPLLDVIEKGLVGTGKVLGDIALDLADVFASPAFKRDVGDVMASNNRAMTDFGKALIPLVKILARVAAVAGPVLLEPFAKWTRATLEAAEASDKLSKSRIREFLQRAATSAKTLWGILEDVVVAIYNLGRLARPSGDTMIDGLADAAQRFRDATEDPENMERIRKFFENTIPIMEGFGNALVRVVELFARFGEITGGGTLDGLFWVLDRVLDVLEGIAAIPGAGTILSTLFLLAGVGLGLGLVAKVVGGLVTNLGRLAKFTGVGLLLDKLRGTGGKDGGTGSKGVKGLADDVDGLTDAIDRELPKDKRKTKAIGDLGDSADGTKKKTSDLGDAVDGVGKKADTSAKKTGRFSRIISGLGRGLGRAVGAVAGFGSLLLKIPGVDKIASFASGFASRVGDAISKAFTSIKVGGKEGGLLARLLPGLMGKLPSVGGVLSSIGTWLKTLVGGIGTAIGRFFSGGKLATLISTAVKGGVKGGAGGPFGIIGGILAALLGDLIGGPAGGALSGGATGAGIGGLIGSIVPGIGTAIGAVIGAVVGAVIGGITGGDWWDDIGRFFTTTLPNWIIEQVRKLPGVITGLLSGVGDFGMMIGTWIVEQIRKIPERIGQAFSWAFRTGLDFLTRTLPSMIGTALRVLPGLIIDFVFGIPALIGKAALGIGNVFGWIIGHAVTIIDSILTFFRELPLKLATVILTVARSAPRVFSWLVEQAQQIVPQILARLREAWTGITRDITTGLTEARARVTLYLGQIGTAFANIKNTIITRLREAWTTITSAAATALTTVRTTISEKLSQIGTAFANIKATIIARLQEAWTNVLSTASTMLTNVKNSIATKLGEIATAFTTAKDNVVARVREAMTDIGNRFATGLEAVRSTATTILGKISGAFGTAKDAIKRLWDQVQEVAAKPVRWIGNNVYNRGIKAVWDKVAALVNMNPLPSFSGFARGGIYPGYTPGRDIGLAAVSGGEAIMRPEWTRAVGSGFVDMMNRLARTGGVKAVRAAMMGGYASGGVVGGIPYAGAFEDGGIIGWLSGLVSSFTGMARAGFADGLKAAADSVLGPLLDVVGQAIGGSGWGDLLTRMPRLAINAFIDFLVKTIEPKMGNKAVVEAAQRYLGRGDFTDGYSGANNNIFNNKWGYGAGTPWCANFVSTAVADAGAGGKYPGYPTAAVYGYYSQMQKVGGDQARAGDLGVYDSPTGHINIIESNQGRGRFTTIGGNENAVVRRANRVGAYAILRPMFALGGVVNRKVFSERNEGFGHDKNDPLYRLLSRLSPTMAERVSAALAQAEWMQRDNGGPLYPGLNVVANNTRGLEWVLTPEAVAMLGGPAVVQSLNQTARVNRSAGNTAVTARIPAAAAGRPTGDIIQNIYPQPRQSEHEIAMITRRKLGTLLGR